MCSIIDVMLPQIQGEFFYVLFGAPLELTNKMETCGLEKSKSQEQTIICNVSRSFKQLHILVLKHLYASSLDFSVLAFYLFQYFGFPCIFLSYDYGHWEVIFEFNHCGFSFKAL